MSSSFTAPSEIDIREGNHRILQRRFGGGRGNFRVRHVRVGYDQCARFHGAHFAAVHERAFAARDEEDLAVRMGMLRTVPVVFEFGFVVG